MALVTIEQAKAHVFDFAPAGAPTDADQTLKLAAAESSVLRYIGTTAHWRPIADAWTSADVPPDVVSAILITFAELWRRRGDDDAGPLREAATDVSPHVAGLLRRYRDPVLA